MPAVPWQTIGLLLGAEASMPAVLWQTIGLLLGAALLGAVPLFIKRWSGAGLHALVAVAAGMFLGILFLHLLPELSVAPTGALARAPWAAALGGLLVLFFVEKIWLERRARPADPHGVVWFATFLGLSAHALVTGLGLAALAGDPTLLWSLALPLSVHKAGESFSLATVLRLGEVRPGRALSFLACFWLATPVGMLLGWHLASGAGQGPGAGPILTGLAAGTFLYVAVCNLLPEVFHASVQRTRRVLGLLAGLALAVVGAWSLP